jgi:hypothetical protein
MADSRLREAERRWAAEPGDQHALATAIAERLRAGLRVPPFMLDAQVFPPTSFESKLPFVIEVEQPDGEVASIACTPSRTPLRVPPHRAWWVSPTADPWRSYGKLQGVARLPSPDSAPYARQVLDSRKLSRALDEVETRRVPGLALRAHSLGEAIHRLPAHLESLDLTRSFSRTGLGPVGQLQRLRRLDLTGMGRIDLRPIRDLPAAITLRLDLAAREKLRQVLPDCKIY